MTYKTCTSCKELKPLDCYYKDPRPKSKSKMRSDCQDCTRERTREYYRRKKAFAQAA